MSEISNAACSDVTPEPLTIGSLEQSRDALLDAHPGLRDNLARMKRLSHIPGLGAVLIGRLGAYATLQADIIRLTTLLPGVRYEQVKAALVASGYSPASLYRVAAAGELLPETFREALYGPSVTRGKE